MIDNLAAELGKRLGVPVELKTFGAAGKSFEAAKAGQIDVLFLAIEPVRAAEVAFTAPYVIIEGVYAVLKDSALKTVADVDREGVRIGVNQASAYDLFLTRSLKHAKLVRGENGVDRFVQEKLEAAAGVKQPIVAYAKARPGALNFGTTGYGSFAHLVSEVSQPDGRVLHQRMVEARSNEIPCVQAMLRGRDLRGVVLTVDAMHTQRETARLIVQQQGHYLMVVKANQPDLHEALSSWFAEPDWGEAEAMERVCTHDAGHGRLEWRTLERRAARTLALMWPGAQQAIRRHCLSLLRASGAWREEVTFALTSVPTCAVGVRQLEAWWRGHWTIEHRLHYVRDVTFAEDDGHARAGATPHVLAALRNRLLTLLRDLGHTNIAAALRHFGASATRALRLVGLCP